MDMQLTTKTQEALSTAMQMALVNGNPEIVPPHILLALLQQGDEGIAVALLDAVGADRTALVAKARALVSALPSASGGDGPKPQLSRQGLTVMQAAQQIAAERGDEFISTEHVLIALSKDGARQGSRDESRYVCRSGGDLPGPQQVRRGPHGAGRGGFAGSGHRT